MQGDSQTRATTTNYDSNKPTVEWWRDRLLRALEQPRSSRCNPQLYPGGTDGEEARHGENEHRALDVFF